MKKNIKTIGYSVVAFMALGAVLSFSSIGKTFAAQSNGGAGDNSVHTSGKPAIIHRGGGHQVIHGRVGLSELMNGVAFDAVSSTNKPAVFEKPQGVSLFSSGVGTVKKGNNNNNQDQAKKQSFLTALGTSWVGGDVFIGVPRDPSGNAGFNYHGVFNEASTTTNPWIINHNIGVGNPLTTPLQKVNVWRSVGITNINSSDGNVLATNLVHSTENDQVCVNKDGSLVICGSFSCTGNTPDSHATMCQNDNVGLSANTPKTLVAACTTDTKCEFTCMSGYHYDSSSKTCVADATYEWKTGVWGSCANTGFCSGNGVSVSTDTTTGDPIFERCSDHSSSESDCNSFIPHDGSCSWNDTSAYYRTREVYCVEQGTNHLAPDTNCDESTRPMDIDKCMRVRAYIARACGNESVQQCCNYNADSEVGTVDVEFTSDSQDIFAPNFTDNKLSFKYQLHPVQPLGYPDGIPINIPYTFHTNSYTIGQPMTLDAGRYAIKSSGAKISTSNGIRAVIQITGNGSDAKLETINFCSPTTS